MYDSGEVYTTTIKTQRNNVFYDIIVYLWLKFNTEFWKTFNGDPVAWLIFIENASWDKFHEVSFTSVFLF